MFDSSENRKPWVRRICKAESELWIFFLFEIAWGKCCRLPLEMLAYATWKCQRYTESRNKLDGTVHFSKALDGERINIFFSTLEMFATQYKKVRCYMYVNLGKARFPLTLIERRISDERSTLLVIRKRGRENYLQLYSASRNILISRQWERSHNNSA